MRTATYQSNLRCGDRTPAAGTPMMSALQRCSDVIKDSVAGRVRELGGTELDVQLIAQSAASAVLMWSAAETFGG